MSFCLVIRVREGLVGICDTRVISGNECITAHKVTVYQRDRQAFFLMTSGLRSVRDKVLTYFDDHVAQTDQHFDRLYKAVNAVAHQLRRVAKEDKAALTESGLSFNLHALIGGQMENDRQPRLYLLYPQGNWVEIGTGSPYAIIGAGGYGKPVLDRTLTHGDSMQFALKVGCLAFDSTRISAADVDFPMDVVLYPRDTFQVGVHRLHKQDMAPLSNWWQERLRASISELPADMIEGILSRSQDPEHPAIGSWPERETG